MIQFVRKLLRLAVCMFNGHIPINIGSGIYDKYGFIRPSFEVTKCSRCESDIPILHGFALIRKIERWELDENTKRSLTVKKLVGEL